MKEITKILACLDLTEMDNHLIRYAVFLSRALKVDTLLFLHVIQEYDLEESEKADLSAVEERLERHIREEIQKNMSEESRDVPWRVLIKRENKDASDVIIQTIRQQEVDLTVLGKKAEEARKERYSARAVALGESDMILVPANPPAEIKKVHVVMDFSGHSKKAFFLGAAIADFTGSSLSCQYIYQESKGFFPAWPGVANKKLIARRARRKKKRFVNQYGHLHKDVDYYVNPAEYDLQPQKIIATADSIGTNLICIGARGSVSVPSTLLGLITQKMRKAQTNTPVLIVKNKLEKNSFWNMLLHG